MICDQQFIQALKTSPNDIDQNFNHFVLIAGENSKPNIALIFTTLWCPLKDGISHGMRSRSI